MKRSFLISSVASALAVASGVPAQRVQLLAMGRNETRNGQPAVVTLTDRAHAQAVVASTRQHWNNVPIVIDYDHQTVFAAGKGGTAPAAGWLTKIYAQDDGIWGDVEWTAAASAALRAGEYRYISPFFFHRPDGRVTKIINAGLTNTPNLDLAAVASALGGSFSAEEDEVTMDLKAIASALGLAEDADMTAVLAAIAANVAKGNALSATASALGVTLGDDLGAVASAATALKTGNPDPARFVPVAAVAELQASVASMQGLLNDQAKERRTTTIAAAINEGRLAPALRAHAESLDEAALASFLAVLPATSLGKKTATEPKAGDETSLTEDEKAIASMMGVASADYLAAKKKEAE